MSTLNNLTKGLKTRFFASSKSETQSEGEADIIKTLESYLRDLRTYHASTSTTNDKDILRKDILKGICHNTVKLEKLHEAKTLSSNGKKVLLKALRFMEENQVQNINSLDLKIRELITSGELSKARRVNEMKKELRYWVGQLKITERWLEDLGTGLSRKACKVFELYAYVDTEEQTIFGRFAPD
ncbi:hypothetical protein HYFRA_00006040 [Hymenoscyphus fraxineus]|uniref:Uncharacterized protein n=1 Tax=Hymenoscyphus fraxineus TaxID=746836 RepID=A0A9N9PTD9_9HELO|nr:hypothetical protein HYFRA_00006040 [Hymenoscyphus fraxineus]